jgi:protein TonB
VVRGAITHKVPPVYPPDALADGVAGVVVLKAAINEKGAVYEVSPVSGPQALARAAMDAVKKWQYQPSLLNGTPVRVETEITVNFKKPN